MILIDTRTSTSLAKRPAYLARLAHSADEVRVAQRLRFEVFNLELNEGLARSLRWLLLSVVPARGRTSHAPRASKSSQCDHEPANHQRLLPR